MTVWRARYRDEAGKQKAKHFRRKTDAQTWLDEVTASVVRCDYVDPNAGRITSTKFYEDWRERQVWVAGTRRARDLAAGSVAFGTVPLGKIRESHIETWVKGMVIDKTGVRHDPHANSERPLDLAGCCRGSGHLA